MPDSSSPLSSSLSMDCRLEGSRKESLYNDLFTNDSEIRLLQIEPAEDPTACIIGRLFKTSLDDAPLYEAVSYRWEQMKDSHIIMVNGFRLPVMGNVFSLLTELRRQSYPSSPTFWIDSVCIDQDNTHNRNEQVQLMGRIYSQALLVRMWIGSESDLTARAFELIRHCRPDNHLPADLIAANVIREETGAKALTELLQREYWNRMWVFQEIVLARQAVVHCGRQYCAWSDLRWLDAVSSKHGLWYTAQIEKPWIFEFRKALFRIAHFCISPHEAQGINNVLHPTRHLRCQDPRDKVYALLGVCDAMKWIVKVDYSVAVRDVFTAFAQQQILQDGHLSALLTAGLWSSRNGDDINLPSWVPDLRGTGDVDMRYVAANQMNSFAADGGHSSFYNACFPIKHDDFLDFDGYVFFNVQAILFDFIQRHMSLEGFTQSNSDRKDLIKAFCVSPSNDKFCVRRLSQLFEGLVFRGKTVWIRSTPTTPAEHVHERGRKLALGFHTDLCELFGPDAAFTDLLGSLEAVDTDSHGYKPLQEEAQLCDQDQLHLARTDYLARATETTERQATALFLTLDGHIGIGPRLVQQNDVIVIVRGCRVPLALRPNGTSYKLIGPVYISGTMQGEVVRSHERSNCLTFEPIQLV